MAVNLSLGLFGQIGNDYTATIDARSRSGVVYDSDAARGNNSADIPASGTTDAPDGTTIQMRLVRADTFAEVQGWQSIGTASGGTWSGTYTGAQRSPHVLEIEARPSGGSATPARTTQGIKIGHVTVQGGASNTARMYNSLYDEGTPADISGNTRVSVILSQSPTGAGSVTDNVYTSVGGDCTSHITKLIRTLMDGAPNDFFAVAFDAFPGTGWKEAFNNNNASRDFSATQYLFNYLQADGANIGMIYMEFSSGFQPGVMDQDEALARFCFAKDMAGSPVAAIQGSNFADYDANYNINYTFQSLITGDQPVFLMASVAPPIQSDTASLTSNDANDWIAQLSLQAAYPNDVKVGIMDAIARRNNFADTHIDETDDGFGRVAAAYGYCTLAGIGYVTPPAAVVEEVATDKIRISSPAGNITTLERLRNGVGATNFGGGNAEVMGIYGSNIPTEWGVSELRTSGGVGATEGEIWILNDGAAFSGDTSMWFMPYRTKTFDGSAGDWDADRWQSFPGVAVSGFAALDMIQLQPPDNAEFINDANGLPATLTWTVTSGSPMPLSAANMASIPLEDGWTVEATVKRSAGEALNVITGEANNNWTRIYIGSSGDIGVKLSGGSGDLINTSTATGLVGAGTIHKIRWSIDTRAASAACRVYLDDVLVDTLSFIDRTRSHTGNQKAAIGRVSNGEFAQVRMWRSALANGDLPAGNPWFQVDAQASSPFYTITYTGA